VLVPRGKTVGTFNGFSRTELRSRPFHFDSIGLSLLVVVMVCWEVMLSKGQEWDWLGDPFWPLNG
jgi:DHA2 family multidrug resistance protein